MSSLAHPQPRPHVRLTVLFLVFGWVLVGFGELIGLALLFTGAWSTRERLIGSLIPLGLIGILISLQLGETIRSCSPGGCTGSSLTASNVVGAVLGVAMVIMIVMSARSLLRRNRGC